MKKFVGSAMLLIAFAGWSAVHAAGAVAIGEPADVVKDGYAAGISYQYKTRGEADDRAMTECQAVHQAPEATRKLCKVMQTFENQCAVIALDPENGTPGAGWAVADTLAGARAAAIERCMQTSPEARKKECRVTAEGCDGKAK